MSTMTTTARTTIAARAQRAANLHLAYADRHDLPEDHLVRTTARRVWLTADRLDLATGRDRHSWSLLLDRAVRTMQDVLDHHLDTEHPLP